MVGILGEFNGINIKSLLISKLRAIKSIAYHIFAENSIAQNMELNASNQFIVISRSDFEAIVYDVAERITHNTVGTQDVPTEQYLTRKEAAALLHVDLSTLWRWDKAGILVARHTGTGGRVLYDSDSLEALLKDHER